MKYDVDYDEFDKEEEPRPKKYFKEPEYDKEELKPRKNFKESECGNIKVKAENVYITINCKEKKDRKDC